MIITCEKCSTKFNLDESLLKKEGSKVRCSQCRHIFTAQPLFQKHAVQSDEPLSIKPDDKHEKKDELEDLTDFDLNEDELDFEFEESEELQEELKQLQPEDNNLQIWDETEELHKGNGEQEELKLADDDLEDFNLEEIEESFDDDGDEEEELTLADNDLENFNIEEIEASLKKDYETREPDENVDPANFSDHADELKLESEGDEDEDADEIEVDFSEFKEILDQDDDSNNFSKIDKDISDENRESPLKDSIKDSDMEKKQSTTDPDANAETEEPEPQNRLSDFDTADDIKRPVRPGKTLMTLLFLAILVLAGYSICIMRGIEIPYISKIEIPYLTKYLQQEEQKPASVKLIPDKKSVKGKFVTNSSAGTLFVITGKVTSNSKIPCSHVKIAGTLITKGKIEAKTKTVFCGNIIDEEKLATLDFSEINTIMSQKTGNNRSNINISIDRPVSFMIIFRDLPDNLENFTVHVAGFDQNNLKK